MIARRLRDPRLLRGGALAAGLVLLVALAAWSAAPPEDVVAYDRFDRTVAEGWEDAPRGGRWRLSGTRADYTVGAEGATVVIPEAGPTRTAVLPEVDAADIETSFLVRLASPPMGGSAYVYPVLRRQEGVGELRAKLRIAPDGALYLGLTTIRAGQEREIVPEERIEEPVWTPGTGLWLRTRIEGAPAVVRIRVWTEGTTEPVAWTMRKNLAADAVPPSGSVGVQVYVSTQHTAFPFTFRIRSFEARGIATGPGNDADPERSVPVASAPGGGPP